ncbi:hypothetical protein ACTXT7_007799 [Hymenolepis weldensis]
MANWYGQTGRGRRKAKGPREARPSAKTRELRRNRSGSGVSPSSGGIRWEGLSRYLPKNRRPQITEITTSNNPGSESGETMRIFPSRAPQEDIPFPSQTSQQMQNTSSLMETPLFQNVPQLPNPIPPLQPAGGINWTDNIFSNMRPEEELDNRFLQATTSTSVQMSSPVDDQQAQQSTNPPSPLRDFSMEDLDRRLRDSDLSDLANSENDHYEELDELYQLMFPNESRPRTSSEPSDHTPL